MKNKFKFVIPSYNNEEWVEYNIASILNQTYENYEVLYIDDASTDNTYNKVIDIVSNDNRFTVIKRQENKGATYNYFFELEDYLIDDNDIIIHLDGDDWLYDENVLENLNNFYNDKGVWMTYGKFYCYRGNERVELGYPQSTPYSDFVLEHKLFRRDTWRASHLRTYRTFLFKALNPNDLYSAIDGKLYWHATDLAFQFAYMEMCPKDKVGVVDFPTCVYNQAPKNSERTAQREHLDNSKYEAEIRNKKKYKEGLSGETLPQVNVIGDFRERNSIPKTFSYVYNLLDGDFDVTLIQDAEIIKYINGQIPINKGIIVADIHEAPHLLDQYKVYDAVKQNYQMFDFIFTFDSELLKLPNAVFRNGGYEVVLNKNVHRQEYPILQDDSLIQIYSKKLHNISFITSNKTTTVGHRFRLECVNEIVNKGIQGVDIFGVGIKEIRGKIDALRDYKYSIAIENGIYKNYFTEKILDCFLTGTIPIYNGTTNIGDFFNPKGFYIFENKQQLIDIILSINDETYADKAKYIEENYKKAHEYWYNNDKLFKKFINTLI
jgi:glycosyltransferase involved in cell wall biosynthesis